MKLLDVNILVYAHRPESPHHAHCRDWLEQHTQSDNKIALADIVASGFLRIVTHPKIFNDPTPLAIAIDMIQALRSHENCIVANPGAKHFSIFAKLCIAAKARGNMVPDAYIAAIAIEHDCQLISADTGFKHFPGLRWSLPK